jgi:hypothetical protein
MLIQEANWFKEQLPALEAAQVFPMCNVGSSTHAFRTQHQPWIDELVFAPLARGGDAVKHLDMKPDPGVDIVGDLGNAICLDRVMSMQFKSTGIPQEAKPRPNPSLFRRNWPRHGETALRISGHFGLRPALCRLGHFGCPIPSDEPWEKRLFWPSQITEATPGCPIAR